MKSIATAISILPSCLIYAIPAASWPPITAPATTSSAKSGSSTSSAAIRRPRASRSSRSSNAPSGCSRILRSAPDARATARCEGYESSDNVIYVGAAPNHTVVPLVRHMLDNIASDVFCVGSNYVWTWETNRVLREIVSSAGGRILAERLLELGETAVDHIVKEIIDRKPPVVFNTLVGESSYVFMRALHAATLRAELSIPMLSCSLCEPELKLIGPEASVGCITSSAYFESFESTENGAFVARWKARHGTDSQPCVDGLSTYVCVMLLARAIRRAGSVEVGAVRRAAANHRYDSPQGPVWVDPDNNHCFLTP